MSALLVIISVIASVAIPAWFGQPQVTLDSAARLLAQDLREVQNRAAYHFRELEIRFAENGDGYACFDSDGEPLRAPVGKANYLRKYSHDAVFRGVEVTEVAVGDDRTVRFDPRGMLESGGHIELSYGGETRVVHIETGTGLLRIEGLAEPWVDSY